MNTRIQPSSNLTVLSKAERVQRQTTKEWIAEYEGADAINRPASPQTLDLQPKVATKNQTLFLNSLKEAGIVSVRVTGAGLLITTDSPITEELNNRIIRALPRLAEIAKPDTGESLYEYVQYRTFFSHNKPCLAIVFKEIYTGSIVERFFNIELKSGEGSSFKTGINGKFKITGNSKNPKKGSFIKFWMDAVMYVPDDRPSHICRYMNSMLSGVVVGCNNVVPHHDGTKLKDLKYEGRIYQTT